MKTKVAILLLAFSQYTHGYGVDSHKELSKASSPDNSTELNAYFRDNLQFNTSELYDYIDERGLITQIKWSELIYNGSRREDDIKPTSEIDRPLNHFFNPLTGGTARWADNPTPDWALGRNVEGVKIYLPDQEYSLADANNYLYKALTSINLDERKQSRQQYFYSLGHVLHLLADMGQPEHVRPDMHPIFEKEDMWYKQLVNDYSNYFGEWSLYEKYTDANINAAISNATTYSAPPITQARDLWVDATVGLSNYTNKNFVSEDTNFNNNDSSFLLLNEYTLPIARPMLPDNDCKPISELYKGTPPTSSVTGQPLSGDVCFISNTVYDTNPAEPSTQVNHRAASLSIFNRDADDFHEACIASSGQGIIFGVDTSCKRYTLNRWNFDAAHGYLIPRIISYGDALLDHLARGKMELSRSDMEHISDLHIHPQFRNIITQLPVNISNATDTGEALTIGSLVAVISYADANGDIVFATSSEINTDPAPQKISRNYTFKFPNGGFPLQLGNYTTYIQVIFRGELGDDIDNIVVARKPLSELITTIDINTDTPDRGIYALVDHKPQVTGFNSLKVKLSSTDSLDGVIMPVVRHHVNYCYTDTLTGEFNVGGQTKLCASSTYRSVESFSIAATQASTILASNLTTTGTEHTIDLSTPIPFNATDLMVDYYHFPDDPTVPIGVGYADISEPTFISFINSTDFTSYKSEYKSYQDLEDILTLKSSFIPKITPAASEVEIIFGTNNMVSAKVDVLDIAHYSRIAVLTGANGFSLTSNAKRLDTPNTTPRSKTAWYPATINQAKVLGDGSRVHQYPGYKKLRNVIAGVNILLDYEPIFPLSDPDSPGNIILADPLTLPDIAPENQAGISLLQP